MQTPVRRFRCAFQILGFCIALFVFVTALPPGMLAQAESKTSVAVAPSDGHNQQLGTTLEQLIRAWLKVPTLRNSSVGLEIMELPTGRVLYSYNGYRRLTPASTVKAITCACALDTFGGDYHFQTVIGAEGKLEGGHLKGNLVVIPSQDPTLSRAELSKLVSDAVNQAGSLGHAPLTAIDGKVTLSALPGSEANFPCYWLVEDWGRNWMPVGSNLVVDKNIWTGTFPSGWRAYQERPTHGAIFDRLLSPKYTPGWLNLDPKARIIHVYKSMHPQAVEGQALIVSNPDEYNSALIQSMLSDKGVKVQEQSFPVAPTDNVFQLSQHSSIPISGIIKTCLHKSDNLYAQQLLRLLGAKFVQSRHGQLSTSFGDGVPISLEDRGLQFISQWLSKIGVSANEVILFDGCGLSRKNGVSPHALNTVMKHMAGEKTNGFYLSLLKENHEGKGTYRYKTGTMDTVRAISGTLTTAGGQNLAVTIMVNSHTPTVKSLKIAQAALINQLRAIKKVGNVEPPIEPGSKNDPAVETTAEPIVLDRTPAPRAKAQPHHGRQGKRKRRH
ncbi:MAG: D-alanyl-D-alanine carboxypeptidase [Cyanobacteria bacterium]|nr:D-alanyl-D-alanine carboxypeptidase [Cyanobacteriota bacterium]